jgi:DNA-binding response OmpR family regulator
LNLIESIFHQENIRLITAMQGSMGLEMAREHRPDLILLDVHLPDIDGHEVMRRLQASSELSPIPVLVLSADAMPSQQQHMLELGARHYMSKPIDVSDFLNVVHRLLRQKEDV